MPTGPIKRRSDGRVYLGSSNPQWYEYDAETQTLRVGFSRGHIYKYYEIPEDILDEWESAPSRGVWFLQNLYYGLYNGDYELERGGNKRRRGRDGRFR